jgi:SAM-dependent methyltransferase
VSAPSSWPTLAGDYENLISDSRLDSKFLREAGLLPNVLNLIGECSTATLLDAGTGTGWLFRHIAPAAAYACDIVRPRDLPTHVHFSKSDVSNMPFADDMFDIVVASLLLIYCEDLHRVCSELRRVAKPRTGRLVISLMHPYFYRTGEINADGLFAITRDLSKPARFPLEIGELVGPFEYFYRPLPDYLNGLIQAGWAITEMRDWFINMDMYQRATSKGKISRTGHVPLFTFIACKKG